MRIGKRLLAIAQMVDKGETVVDIGSDHAFLDVFLIKNGIVNSAIAIENKIEPLNATKKTIKKYHLEDKITAVFSDGIKGLQTNNYDTVIMAGLGGETIKDLILRNDIIKDATIILEPNTNQKEAREALMMMNYQIIDEKLLMDRTYYYMIIKAKKVPSMVKLSELELSFGPIILRSKPKELIDLVEHNIKLLEYGLTISSNRDPIYQKIKFFKSALSFNASNNQENK